MKTGKYIIVLCILAAAAGTTMGATHYVDLASPSPTAPYTNWVTAANNIQDAVDAAVDRETVLVADGHYLLLSEIVVTNEITIQSINGPESTIVDGQGIVRCFNLDDYACVVSGLTIANGYASEAGGGIYCYDTAPVVTNCWIIDSRASYGGGVYHGTANNCTISGNSADSYGGGMVGGTANNCIISGNHANDNGGGMRSGTANNCTISGNSADLYGGGTRSVTANNCTISGNSADFNGGGMYYGTANNCIVWYNICPSIPNVQTSPNLYGLIVRSTCSPDVNHGLSGNITNAPLLVSASHVAADSPCRGAGSSTYAAGTDIDGESWQDPPSMGCDEIHEPFIGKLQVATESSPVVVGYPVTIRGDIEGVVTMHVWDLGDGTRVTNNVYPVHTWNNPGSYDVVLTAYNDTYPLGVSATQTIHVATLIDSAVYVAMDGSDANDGFSWATAKATIQAGVDAQIFERGLVLVSNGTYAVTSEIVVAGNITVQGVNGPSETVVDGQGNARCFNLGNKACILSGLTITNGYTSENGGGIYCSQATPVITNSIIIGNNARSGGGIYYGTANNCTISGNSAAFDGGGIYYGTANDSIISNNVANQNGGGMSRGTASNCAIVHNFASYYGGGMHYGEAIRCSVGSNVAGSFGGGLYTATASSSSIIGNTATNAGGGMYRGTANNCTIIGNTATNSSGGMYYGTAINCIVWSNVSPSEPNLRSTTADYTCSPDVTHGANGNITNAPMFVDGANGNYRLLAGSPCINAGDNSYVSYGADLDGHPRIINGIVDMGAYEYGFHGCFITNFVVTNSEAVLEWTTFPMWESQVFWTTNLLNGFQPLQTGIDYPLNSYTDTGHAAANQCFYEVKVRMK